MTKLCSETSKKRTWFNIVETKMRSWIHWNMNTERIKAIIVLLWNWMENKFVYSTTATQLKSRIKHSQSADLFGNSELLSSRSITFKRNQFDSINLETALSSFVFFIFSVFLSVRSFGVFAFIFSLANSHVTFPPSLIFIQHLLVSVCVCVPTSIWGYIQS